MMILGLALIILVVVREYIILVERREWLSERRELINRVQAPERLPNSLERDFVIPEPETDEFALVGVVGEWTVDE